MAPGGARGRSAPRSRPFSLAAPGVTHVIVREDPYRVSGDQMALGLLAGAATGGPGLLHVDAVLVLVAPRPDLGPPLLPSPV